MGTTTGFSSRCSPSGSVGIQDLTAGRPRMAYGVWPMVRSRPYAIGYKPYASGFQRWPAVSHGAHGFEGVTDAKQSRLVEGASDQLQADGQARRGQAARHGQGRVPGHVDRPGATDETPARVLRDAIHRDL